MKRLSRSSLKLLIENSNSGDLDHIVSLERSAHITLHLLHELQASSEVMSQSVESSNITQKNSQSSDSTDIPWMNMPLPKDKEEAQFLMKLPHSCNNPIDMNFDH